MELFKQPFQVLCCDSPIVAVPANENAFGLTCALYFAVYHVISLLRLHSYLDISKAMLHLYTFSVLKREESQHKVCVSVSLLPLAFVERAARDVHLVFNENPL